MADDRVAGVLPLGHGGQHQSFGQFGGQIFQAVDGEVRAAIEQRLLDFLGEESLAADFGQRHVGDFIAGGLDDFDAAFVPGGSELGFHPAGLPERELGTTGSDYEHELVSPVAGGTPFEWWR